MLTIEQTLSEPLYIHKLVSDRQQAQVLNLIKQLQRDSGVSMLFISHDLGVVKHISDRIAVMYQGRIVESGDRRAIFDNTQHSYTKKLLASIPRIPTHRRAS